MLPGAGGGQPLEASLESPDCNRGKAMSDPGQCANCGHPVADTAQKFCPACGQPTPARRIDWRFLGQQLADGVFSMERGIAYYLAQLMLRTGHSMRDYIGGRRGRQAKQLLLLMVTAALMVRSEEHTSELKSIMRISY